MKVLKVILYIVLVLALVYIILCFTGPKKLEMQKSMMMNATPDAIFEEISDFNKWNAWSPWHKLDPNMKTVTTGTPGMVGHKQEWHSDNNKVGSGTQEFVEVKPDAYIRSEMHFEGMGEAPNYAAFKLDPVEGGTNVTWSMDGAEVPFMMRGMMKMAMGMMEEQFNNGLTDIKKIAEAKPPKAKTPEVAYEVTEWPATWYVGKVYPAIHEDKIESAMFADSYAQIAKAIGGNDKMTGAPMSIARNYNQETHTMDLIIAMPVASEMKAGDGLISGMIPAGLVAKHVYHGPYMESGKEWGMFIGALTKDHKPRGNESYELYTNDPANVKPEEVETVMIQPIM